MKNGPALGGYGAVAMNAALTAAMAGIPEQLRKTITWDRGKELSGHAQFALDTGTKVYFLSWVTSACSSVARGCELG